MQTETASNCYKVVKGKSRSISFEIPVEWELSSIGKIG